MDINQKLQKAIEEQRELYNLVFNSNQKLEEKAITILQTSSGIIGLVAAGTLIGDQSPKYLTVGISLTVITYVIIVGLTLYVWYPQSKSAPNNPDWDDIFQKHIYANDEDDLTQTLSNYVDAANQERDRNKLNADLVTLSIVLLALQVLIIAITLIT